jgi:hypothetical protein
MTIRERQAALAAAKEDVDNIEAHIRMLFTEEYLVSIGANVQAPNHQRELHHRVFRLLCQLKERLDAENPCARA